VARMLAAKGRPAWVQAVQELLVYGLGVLALAAIIGGMLGGWRMLGKLLGVAVPVTCLSFMLYALAGDLIGGVLLQFFVTAALCFVSGCMYPVYFFPVAVQKVAAWLPYGAARRFLATYFTGGQDGLGLLLVYSAVFCAVGVLARTRAVKEARV